MVLFVITNECCLVFVHAPGACENGVMSEAKLESYFFTAVFLVALFIVGIIFYPFIGALALAAVLAALIAPVHEWVYVKIKNRVASALIVTTLTTCAIILPAIGIVILLVDEVRTISEHVMRYNFEHSLPFVSEWKEKMFQVLPATSSIDVGQILQNSFNNLSSHIGGAVTGTANLILKFFVALVALYYFFKDGKKFLYEIVKLSPLKDMEDVAIVHKLDAVTHSLIRGTLVIAVLQGLFVGMGFVLFGIPNPVLWGFIAAVSALIPTLGTSLVTTPAIVYLFVTGDVVAGIGLLAWALLIVGLVDNIIYPKIVGSDAKIHPLFVLLSVMGGIILFGISGFLLGPLFLGFLVALSEIYKAKIKELHEKQEQGTENTLTH